MIFSFHRMKFCFSSYSLRACLSSTVWKLQLVFKLFTCLVSSLGYIVSPEPVTSRVSSVPQKCVIFTQSCKRLSCSLSSVSIFLSALQNAAPYPFSLTPIPFPLSHGVFPCYLLVFFATFSTYQFNCEDVTVAFWGLFIFNLKFTGMLL